MIRSLIYVKINYPLSSKLPQNRKQQKTPLISSCIPMTLCYFSATKWKWWQSEDSLLCNRLCCHRFLFRVVLVTSIAAKESCCAAASCHLPPPSRSHCTAACPAASSRCTARCPPAWCRCSHPSLRTTGSPWRRSPCRKTWWPGRAVTVLLWAPRWRCRELQRASWPTSLSCRAEPRLLPSCLNSSRGCAHLTSARLTCLNKFCNLAKEVEVQRPGLLWAYIWFRGVTYDASYWRSYQQR